jgi:N-sulfoglucosamine sulfohydrolase
MAYRLSRDKKYDGTKVREAFDRLANPPEYELYDLQEDPYEFTNLADDARYADELDELKTVLQHWREEKDDPLLNDSIVNAHLNQARLDITNNTRKRTLPDLMK